MRPAGDGGQDGDDVVRGDLGVQLVEITDVVVVDVHVDEAMQAALVREHLAGNGRVGLLERLEDLTDRVPVDVHDRLTAGGGTEHGG